MKLCPTCNQTYPDAVRFCERDGEVLEEANTELATGRVLDGQYEIEAFIARGGMGALYRARHILLGDRVVIKTLRADMRNEGEWLRRFQREGRAARRFRHPNAVTVYDLRTTDDGLTYMVMEFAEGHTLERELKLHGRFSPTDAFAILAPVGSALAAAHEQGVVHRDLKPENVMLNRATDNTLTIKLLDLGIAKLRGVAEGSVSGGDGAALTFVGQLLGTPYYMSPEQWGELQRDHNAEIDGRADLYSLGVIFYELIAGAKPFNGKTLAELRHAHVSTMPPPLDEVVPGVSPEFGAAVARALAKDRADRQETVLKLIHELRSAIGFAPTTVADRLERAAIDGSGGEVDDAGFALNHGRLTAVDAVSAESPTMALPEVHATVPPRAGVAMTSPAAVGRSFTTHAVVAEATGIAAAAVTPANLPATSLMEPTLRGSSRWLPVAVGVLALAVLSGGGWLWWRSRAAPMPEARMAAPSSSSSTTAAPALERVEALSYWIEAFAPGGKAASQRRVAEAGALRLASMQQFKFHFVSGARGYLYLIGPGVANRQTTFLTARPSGVIQSNQLVAGGDFSFPSGAGNVIELDRNPGAEEYTAIFSPTPLLAPAFLAAKAMHELTPVEVKELEDFRSLHKHNAPTSDVKETAGGRVVSVSVPRAAEDEPLIFDIRVEHQ